MTTAEQAEAVYGVVIDAESLTLDAEATARARAARERAPSEVGSA